MREQGSLKGEGTHRGNLFVHNSEQNLPGRYGCFCIRRFKGVLYGRARIGEICSSIILVKICQVRRFKGVLYIGILYNIFTFRPTSYGIRKLGV